MLALKDVLKQVVLTDGSGEELSNVMTMTLRTMINAQIIVKMGTVVTKLYFLIVWMKICTNNVMMAI